MPVVASSFVPARQWAAGLDEVAQRLALRFPRTEPRQRAVAYLQGLLSPVERKNSWQLAEQAGDESPYGVQHLLGRATWNADAVRDDLRAYVIEHLGDPEGVLIVDETGFLKKGDQSAGVQRQYSGTAGGVENCQVGVFLAYHAAGGRTFLDRALYVPRSWSEDPQRCQAAGIPQTVTFATKPVLARQMLKRAFDAGVPARWVAGDSVYGSDSQFRRFLQERSIAYVLGVTSDYTVRPYTVGGLPTRCPGTLGSGAVPEMAAKGPVVTSGRSTGCISMKPAGVTGSSCAGRSERGTREPTTGCLLRRTPRSNRWWPWPGSAGRWRSASKPPKARAASMSMRCAVGRGGTGISRCHCWPMPI
jgi:DDE superfamily endonuclease